MGTHVVVGGVISPVHDAYAKKELASATHRCSMLRLALQNNDWIRLSTWETRQNCWTKTRLCLQHHQNLLNSMLSNSNDIKHHMQIEDIEWIPENLRNSSDNTPIQIKLLCGADLLESFGICGLWLEEDVSCSPSRSLTLDNKSNMLIQIRYLCIADWRDRRRAWPCGHNPGRLQPQQVHLWLRHSV